MSRADRMRQNRRLLAASYNSGQTAIVAKTANDPEDEVYVKFPYGEEPNRREGPVRWHPKAGPIYPVRGDEGIVIFTESNEPWLLSWESDEVTVPDDVTADLSALDTRLDALEAMEAVHIIGAVGEPAFTNAWVHVDGVRQVGYYKRFGRVYLKGCMSTGTPGASAFTLPVGYRPVHQVQFPIRSGGTTNVAYCSIESTGTVTVANFGSSNVQAAAFMDGIHFIGA